MWLPVVERSLSLVEQAPRSQESERVALIFRDAFEGHMDWLNDSHVPQTSAATSYKLSYINLRGKFVPMRAIRTLRWPDQPVRDPRDKRDSSSRRIPFAWVLHIECDETHVLFHQRESDGHSFSSIIEKENRKFRAAWDAVVAELVQNSLALRTLRSLSRGNAVLTRQHPVDHLHYTEFRTPSELRVRARMYRDLVERPPWLINKLGVALLLYSMCRSGGCEFGYDRILSYLWLDPKK